MSTALLLIVVIALIPVVAILVILLIGLIRSAILHGRSGSFPAFLLANDRWVRGIAEYGRANLAWRKSFSLYAAPNLVISRRQIDVLDAPAHWEGNELVVVTLNVSGGAVTLALRSGDAAGLISWIDSSPPGE